jgi:transcriptional regulator with XRE-family HTH domain
MSITSCNFHGSDVDPALSAIRKLCQIPGMRIGEKIDTMARERGLTPAALSRLTGIPSPRFSEWKQSDADRPRGPTVPQLLAVARVLNTTMEYLADDTMSDPPPPAVSDAEGKLLWALRALEVDPDEALRLVRHGLATRPPIKDLGHTDLGGESVRHHKRAKGPDAPIRGADPAPSRRRRPK